MKEVSDREKTTFWKEEKIGGELQSASSDILLTTPTKKERRNHRVGRGARGIPRQKVEVLSILFKGRVGEGRRKGGSIANAGSKLTHMNQLSLITGKSRQERTSAKKEQNKSRCGN